MHDCPLSGLMDMTSQWQQFLAARGARVADGRAIDFGDPAAERAAVVHEPIITDLGGYGIITAAGEDAAAFLQNQLTNDVRRVDEGHGQLNGYCTPKGRLLAIFRLLHDGKRFYLRMPSGLIEPLLKRLRMYVLMSKVTLEDAGDETARLGIAGPGAGDVLGHQLGGVPGTVDAVSRTGGCLITCVPGTERYEVYGPAQTLQELWQALEASLRPVGADAWPLLDIINGIPTVYQTTSERFVPQTVNLDLIGGVNFKKGCYPGQEVVARMHYRGTPKRRMIRFSAHADTPPEPGSPVFEPGTTREAGEVVDARPWADGGCQGLAAVQLASLEKGLVLEGGVELKTLELPYGLE